MNIDSFIEKIFNEKPKDRKTINLEFTDIESNIENKNLNKIIFDELVYILTKGIKILYKKNIDIEFVTNDDIKIINKYFNSFGFNINLKISNIIDINNLDYLEKLIDNLPEIDNHNINVSSSDELKNYSLIIKKNSKKFIINFDFIN